MSELGYRLLNVFAIDGERWSGNPLAVFPDGASLDDEAMLAIARELNLSETTFVLPKRDPAATARVRIFTPSYEMPFAGHPTLGTAYVVSELAHGARQIVLEMKAGLVRVTRDGARLELAAAKAPVTRPWTTTDPDGAAVLARAMGVAPAAIASPPLWVDTGVEQLVVRLEAVEDVRAMRADPSLLLAHARSERTDEGMVYVFADEGDGRVEARFVFSQLGSLVEDPATGSACANLGGYLLATGAAAPFDRRVHQGAAVDRPSALGLRVDARGTIHVGGLVSAVGGGTLRVSS